MQADEDQLALIKNYCTALLSQVDLWLIFTNLVLSQLMFPGEGLLLGPILWL
jgi:hypothetical protein